MTQFEGARERLVAWLRDYGEAKSPEFVADIKAVLTECARLQEAMEGRRNALGVIVESMAETAEKARTAEAKKA